jgi:hypothetical protein
MHVLSSILAVPPSVEIAPDGHSSTQIPHPVHISLFTHGTCLSPLHSSHRNRGPPMTPAARTLPSQLGADSIASSHHLVPLPATVTPERLQRNRRLAPNAPRLAGSLPSMSAVLPTERLLGCFVSALPKRVSCPPSGSFHPDSNGFHLAVRSGTVEQSRRSLQQAARRRHLTEDRSDTSFGRTCPAMAWPARDRDRDERSTR